MPSVHWVSYSTTAGHLHLCSSAASSSQACSSLCLLYVYSLSPECLYTGKWGPSARPWPHTCTPVPHFQLEWWLSSHTIRIKLTFRYNSPSMASGVIQTHRLQVGWLHSLAARAIFFTNSIDEKLWSHTSGCSNTQLSQLLKMWHLEQIICFSKPLPI